MKKYLTTALFVIFLCIITVSMCGCSLFNKGDESKSEEVIDSATGKSILIKAVRNSLSATDIKVEGTMSSSKRTGTVNLVEGGTGNDYKCSLIQSGLFDDPNTQYKTYIGYYDGYGLCYLFDTYESYDNDEVSKGFSILSEDEIDEMTGTSKIDIALGAIGINLDLDYISNPDNLIATKVTTNNNKISYILEFEIIDSSSLFSYTVTVKDNYVVSCRVVDTGKDRYTSECKISYGEFDVPIPESLDGFEDMGDLS